MTGFGQGLRRSTGSVAAILGPLWAGATLHIYHVMLGVPLGILVGVMVSCSGLINCFQYMFTAGNNT